MQGPGHPAALDEFASRLAAHVEAILGAAFHARPGGDHAWDRVMAHYGASPSPALARLDALRRGGQTRGATVDEVRRALDAMVGGARAELDRTWPPSALDGASDPRLDALRAHLTRVADQAIERYAAAVLTPRGAVASSVASVFANAQSTAKNTPWAGVSIDPARVLACRECGAPQEVVLDFTCRYCRASLAATPSR